MSGVLLVAGTGSDAGKSVLVAGLLRALAREGLRVAPFKAQNMALNAAVTVDGSEIGRAQALQAAAAGVPPEAAMNPILLKPTGERVSQVVVLGEAIAVDDALAYHRRKPSLLPTVLDCLASLRSRFDAVICEGAGSPAEINLREGDLVNLGLARAADIPVVLAADIERGGVFAALFGSVALLEPADQALVAGFVINRLRGDPALLDPGIAELTARTGRPVLGVVPFDPAVADGDAEDSLALERLTRHRPDARAAGGGRAPAAHLELHRRRRAGRRARGGRDGDRGRRGARVRRPRRAAGHEGDGRRPRVAAGARPGRRAHGPGPPRRPGPGHLRRLPDAGHGRSPTAWRAASPTPQAWASCP